MCLYVLREKCTGVQKNSAFGALCEASGAFHICGANISGRRYFARCAEMNFMEKGPAEKQVLFLVDDSSPNPNPSLEGEPVLLTRKVLVLQEVRLYAVVILYPSGSSHTVTEFTRRSMIRRLQSSSSILPPWNFVSQNII